jgi:RNA polymerase sigma-70 factor (ECF subfamily)
MARVLPLAPPEQQRDQYARLIEPYRAALGRAAYRLTANHAEADDLVQETLLRAYTRLHLLRRMDSIGGWLYMIQLNLFRNRYRQADVLARPSQVSLNEGWLGQVQGAATPDPEQSALRSHRHAAMLRALAGLPPAYREALLLRDVEGKSYQQIAGALRLPIGTVRSRINRGRRQLRRRLFAWQDAD